MKNGYELKTQIESGPVTSQQIMSVLESTAGGDTERWNLSSQDLAQRYNAMWMLARCVVNLEKPVVGPGELLCQTCHRDFNGILFYRDFDLYLNGQKLGEAVQAWIVSDITSRKMLKLNDMPGFEMPPCQQPRETQIAKLKTPRELVEAGTYEVTRDDIDINGHMNNSRYLSAAQSVLDRDFPVRNFQTGFLKETRLGQRINLLKADTDKGIHVRGIHDNGAACFDVLFFK